MPTRNVRLSAIHAFFHFVASRNPEHLGLAQRVLGILFRRTRQRVIDYLEYEEIDSILKAINRTTAQGARDYARMATMFNTGARAQEIADLRIRDLQLVKPFQVRLFGEGKKERYFPIWPQTATVLRAFYKGRDGGGEQHNADSLDKLSTRGSWPGRSCPRRDCR